MKSILTVLFFLVCSASFGQGFNNDQKIDQKDLLFLFQQAKLTPFKFTFSGASDSACNVVVEQYLNGKLVKKDNFYEGVKAVVTASDEPKSYFFPPLNGQVKPMIRLYFDEAKKDVLRVLISVGNIDKQCRLAVPVNLLTQIRAFDDIPALLYKRQPLVAYYGDGGTLISCPGDASPKQIAKMYKVVVVVYAEPIRP